jgi:hypothetical protein
MAEQTFLSCDNGSYSLLDLCFKQGGSVLKEFATGFTKKLEEP